MVGKIVKLVRWAVNEYGVRGTLALIPTYVFHRSAYYVIEGALGFDRRHGTDTTTMVDPLHFGADAEATKGAHVYMACAPWVLERAIAALPLTPAELTFVDYGSGKGRALIVAAEQGFDAVVGVELSPKLCDVARSNAETFRSRNPGAPEITIHCADARELELPTGDCVLFFFNPFGVSIMRAVLSAIRSSVQDNPRRVFVLFQNEEPARDVVDEASDWLQLIDRARIGPMMGSWAAYEARVDGDA